MAVAYVLVLFFIGNALAGFPREWFSCQQNSSDYDACLTKVFTDVVKTLKDGDEDMGIDSLEPMKFPPFDYIPEDNSSSIPPFNMSQVEFLGLSTLEIINTEHGTNKIVVVYSINSLIEQGNYSLDGKIYSRCIYGNGKFNLLFENVQMKLDASYEKFEKDGESYFRIVSMPLYIETSKLTLQFDDLFDGNKEQGEEMNKLLNENWKEIITVLAPSITKWIANGLKDYMNLLLEKISFKIIFGENIE